MFVPAIDTHYRLQDNLTASTGRIFLTGTQALLRLLLAQKQRDAGNGLHTAGFVSGYRGSPLGGVDLTMWHNQDLLDQNNIRFLPAINEDLAATIIMGAQQAGMRNDRKVDGVFSMWYGKGPGLDRAGDALHHGNAAGASQHGGVLLIVGDDHTAASSSIPHASEASLTAWRIPIVHPASVDEYELFGLWGWALSRYSGTWVALKAVTDTVESGRSFSLQEIPDFSVTAEDPHNGALPYSTREFLTPAIEDRMSARLDAVSVFCRWHPLDRLHDAAPAASVGIITTGKAFLDACDALKLLHTDTLPPIRHYKIGLSWPLDEAGFRQFAQGLEHILVIEEKNSLIESQIKDLLYNQVHCPTICGKQDLQQQPLIPASGRVHAALLVPALRHWLHQTGSLAQDNTITPPPKITAATARPVRPQSEKNLAQTVLLAQDIGLTRRPYFCSGCPHSTSTRVPEGSQARGGVGCHYMAAWMDRNTGGLTQMGGEGADWIGLSPYIDMPHVFQNMGEGTYFHSGYLAIRQAIAAKANITYKILFNDAVAMTGGQPVDGPISVPNICQQLRGEGVERIVITTDDPSHYKGIKLVSGVTVHHRHELDHLQRQLRETPGVTVLIHDQACAAEKRRRRKHKAYPDPNRRLFINTAVCEGCGDCGIQSNCLSLLPVDTPFGRKRAINQSSCNKDYTCVDGFCPSFVSVIGGTPRTHRPDQPGHDAAHIQALLAQLPEPDCRHHDDTCNVLVAGIGGTGIVTVGAILSMAAHLEGRAASVLDITGLAQKGGAVISHVRLSENADTTGAVRIDAQQADVAILCDVVAATQPQILAALCHGSTHAAVNTWLAPTAEFTRNPDVDLNPDPLIRTIQATAGQDNTWLLDAHTLAIQQFGDSIFSNMMMLGFTWQQGGIPLSEAAILHALELNGIAVSTNQAAFRMGRLAAWQPEALVQSPQHDTAAVIPMPETLEQVQARCRASLTAYQNLAYAKRYQDVIDMVHKAEQALRPDARPYLTVKVAQSLHKLMAYKDEYEVARLFTDDAFRQQLNDQFEGEFSLRFHLAPPLLAQRDPHTGIPRKITVGPWLEKAFRVLAYGKHLRGTWLDVFSYTKERQMERRLIQDYRTAVLTMARHLSNENFALALELADLPQQVRGFGHIKHANAMQFDTRLAALISELSGTFTKSHNFPPVSD